MSKIALRGIHNLAGNPSSAKRAINSNSRQLETIIAGLQARFVDEGVESTSAPPRLALLDMNSYRVFDGGPVEVIPPAPPFLVQTAQIHEGDGEGYSNWTFYAFWEGGEQLDGDILDIIPVPPDPGGWGTAVSGYWGFSSGNYEFEVNIMMAGSVGDDPDLETELFNRVQIINDDTDEVVIDLEVGGDLYWAYHNDQETVTINGIPNIDVRYIQWYWYADSPNRPTTKVQAIPHGIYRVVFT